MERKIKHLGIAFGAAIAVATAFLPLTSYAAPTAPEGKEIADSRDGQVSVIVNSSISLEVFVKQDDNVTNVTDPSTSENPAEMNLSLEPNMTTQGTFTARVNTNKSYQLSLSAPENGSVNLVSTNSSNRAVIPGNGKVVDPQSTPTESGWGVKLSTDSTWHALPATLENAVFFTQNSPLTDANNDTDFNVGISIAGDIPRGTYKGSIVVTAANI